MMVSEMFDVGRMCVKIAGRDAGKQCVVVDVLDHTFVMVDGETRRRKVNIKHLEPLDKIIDIAKNASHDDVKASFESMGTIIKDSKPKKKAARPKRVKQKVKKVTGKKQKTAKPNAVKTDRTSLESAVESKKAKST